VNFLPIHNKNAILRCRHAALLFPKFLQGWSRSLLRAFTGISKHLSTRPSACSSESPTDSPPYIVDLRHQGESMHIIHGAVIESAQQPSQAASKNPTLTEQSSSELSQADHLGIQYVTSFPFAPDARVAGYLIKADIGPTSYGHLYGTDLPPGANFVAFEAIGVDSRGGYDIVRTAAGVAYVIVTYASHARERGLSHLKEHIGANPDHYAARLLILSDPWPHSQQMIDQLEAG
jgi:hypothetical protein